MTDQERQTPSGRGAAAADKAEEPARADDAGAALDKELENKYKRALADYQNLLRRSAAEKREFAQYANEELILAILPVYDNLKESLKHIDDAARESGWAEGIRLVVRQFKDVLTAAGVEEIEAAGKAFDPSRMEAVEGQGDQVGKVMKAGYALRGKVIVPARVALC